MSENIIFNYMFEHTVLLIERAALLLFKSIDLYWPGDAEGKNDPPERNLSVHFASVLLSADFAVFAEARHYRCKTKMGRAAKVDILGIDPLKRWYIAAEFKKQKGHYLVDSKDDIERVATFSLNASLSEDRHGPRRTETVRYCNRGIGLVAGLKWFGGKEIPCVDSIRGTEEGKLIIKRGGTVGHPILVRENKVTNPGACGRYYILFGIMPICPVGGNVCDPRWRKR